MLLNSTFHVGVFTCNRLAELVIEVLAGMSYVIDEDVLVSTDERRLIGRQGARKFKVLIFSDGTLWFNVTYDYKSRNCNLEAQKFMAGLKSQGVRGLWESNYSFNKTVLQFRHTLRLAGYIFYEVASDEGLIITLRKNSKEQNFRVLWNGKLEGDLDIINLEQQLPKYQVVEIPNKQAPHK